MTKMRWIAVRKLAAPVNGMEGFAVPRKIAWIAESGITELITTSVIPRLIVEPVLRSVEPIADATPRRSGRTAVIMAARFGEAKSPIPAPTRINAGVRERKESFGPIVASHTNPAAETPRPATRNGRGP